MRANTATLALSQAVGRDSNYEQRRGRKVLHQETNNELHNSDERNFMKWLVLKTSKGYLL